MKSIPNLSASRATACLLLGAALSMVAADASAQRGGGRGGGGGRTAQSSISGANHAGARASAGNRANAGNVSTGNRVNTGNVNTGNRVNTGDVNINRGDVNIDVDRGYGGYGGYDHPVAAGMAIGAIAATTAAVIGASYYALPSGCSTVIRNGASYYYCGSVYYQQTMSGDDVVYVAVNP